LQPFFLLLRKLLKRNTVIIDPLLALLLNIFVGLRLVDAIEPKLGVSRHEGAVVLDDILE